MVLLVVGGVWLLGVATEATTAGRIEIQGSSAEVNAETIAGEIRLIDYSGLSAALKTTAGGVTVEAVTSPGDAFD